MLWGLNIKNMAKFPLDTDCHPACQELGISSEVSLLWRLGFLVVGRDLREHHIEAGRREAEEKAVCVPVVPVWEEAAASPSIDSIFAEG